MRQIGNFLRVRFHGWAVPERVTKGVKGHRYGSLCIGRMSMPERSRDVEEEAEDQKSRCHQVSKNADGPE